MAERMHNIFEWVFLLFIFSLIHQFVYVNFTPMTKVNYAWTFWGWIRIGRTPLLLSINCLTWNANAFTKKNWSVNELQKQ